MSAPAALPDLIVPAVVDLRSLEDLLLPAPLAVPGRPFTHRRSHPLVRLARNVPMVRAAFVLGAVSAAVAAGLLLSGVIL